MKIILLVLAYKNLPYNNVNLYILILIKGYMLYLANKGAIFFTSLQKKLTTRVIWFKNLQ